MFKIILASSLTLILAWPITTLALFGNFQPALLNPSRSEGALTPGKFLLGEVDIIAEAETYVPYFYAGRAEPSAGNNLHLFAVPRLDLPETESLTYRWSVNRAALGSTNQRVTVPLSNFGELLVSVQVLNTSGTLLAQNEEYISISSPRVVFYEQNSLRGSSYNAIMDQLIQTGEEATIKAEPYFLGKNELPPLIRSHWTVNSTQLDSSGDWRTLTISNQTTDGRSLQIGFNMEHTGNFTNAANYFLLTPAI